MPSVYLPVILWVTGIREKRAHFSAESTSAFGLDLECLCDSDALKSQYSFKVSVGVKGHALSSTSVPHVIFLSWCHFTHSCLAFSVFALVTCSICRSILAFLWCPTRFIFMLLQPCCMHLLSEMNVMGTSLALCSCNSISVMMARVANIDASLTPTRERDQEIIGFYIFHQLLASIRWQTDSTT